MKGFIILQAIFVMAFALHDTEFLKKKFISKRMKNKTLYSNRTFLDIAPNIIGGTEAAPHSHPWTVALYTDGGLFCGGVLISNQWVLTVAHCFQSSDPSVTVQLGAHNLQDKEPTQVILRGGNTIYIHEDFKNTPQSYDIALIKFAEPIHFTDAIQPIILPSETTLDINKDVLLKIAGWGVIVDEKYGKISDVLLEADVYTISNTECINVYGHIITDSVLCTVGGYGTCFGDVGGPLTYAQGEVPILRGLISYIPLEGCLSPHPHLYTRIKYHLPWIKAVSGV